MRRLLCVWLPDWPIQHLRLTRPALFAAAPDAPPLATVELLGGQRRLAAVCPRAAAAGLRAGMPLTQARAMYPDLSVVDADPAADRAGLAALATWAERYTPLAAADPPDGLVLDITGCAHFFANPDDEQEEQDAEAALAADLLGRLARRDIAARAAIAGSQAAAWALARWRERITALLPGSERAALASLPIGLLRLEPRDVAGLRRLGIRSVGELARLPRGEVSARFGRLPVQRLDEAFAAAAEAIVWPHPPAPWREHMAFAEPIAAPEDLARALARLTELLCERLAEARQGGLRFTAIFLRTDGARPTITIATARPVREPVYVGRLLTAKLESVDPGFGLDAITLIADAVAPLDPSQTGLDDWAGPQTGEFAATVDDLANRLGSERLWRPAPSESHVPERAVGRAPPLAETTLAAARAGWPVAVWTDGESLTRPLRLLPRPELIEVTAPVPDDPPLLFRWRGHVHRVCAGTGPERIAAEWWRRAPTPDEAELVRDYYRVEDSDGARFWLFRTGRDTGAPGARWYLHGVFG